MFVESTAGVKVIVETTYQADISKPSANNFVHSYHVRFENFSGYEIQLLNRYFEITSGDGAKRIVEGIGVVGKTPVLRHEQSFEYSSYCPLKKPIGKMTGHYIFKNLHTMDIFQVQMPEFVLVADLKLN